MAGRSALAGIALAVSLAISVGIAPAPTGTIVHVDCNNTTGIEDGTPEHPYDTIQEGIDGGAPPPPPPPPPIGGWASTEYGSDAVGGDTVLVHPGTYHERIDFRGKAITVTSTDPTDPAVVAATVIDGEGAGTVVTFDGDEGPASVLTGFTITNGSADDGGGISCLSTSPTITRCRIEGNQAYFRGTGIFCEQGSPAISYCRIGGNAAAADGGAIYFDQASATLLNNIVTGNTASRGGAFFIDHSTLDVTHCTIADNTTTSSSSYGEIQTVSSETSICNSIIWDDEIWTSGYPYSTTTVTYSDTSWTQSGEGNISLHPAFDSGYHLRRFSPCIDVGTPACSAADDIDGDARPSPDWGQPDMGADEYPLSIVSCASDPTHVDAASACPNPDGSAACPYRTIQDAIDAACDGYTVLVQPGIYQESITFRGKALTVTSVDPFDPAVVASTVIDAGGIWTVVSFINGEGADSVLQGFTVRNGGGTPHTSYGDTNYDLTEGGGVQCLSTSPTITDNVITENEVTFYGGGIHCYKGASPVIERNDISNNAACWGGGIACESHCDPVIEDNAITGNVADPYAGGGIRLDSYCSPPILNNTIVGNTTASDGGGIDCGWQCDPLISGNLIADNTVTGTAVPVGGGINVDQASAPIITGNVITGNRHTRPPGFHGIGGGIGSMWNWRTFIISDNLISDNTAKMGGGIGLWITQAIITNNTISGNHSTERGGGIYMESEADYPQAGQIEDNLITGNHAAADGGAISLHDRCAPDILRNAITGNIADMRGGGIDCYEYADPIIARNLIAGNTAGYGGGIGCQMGSEPQVVNDFIVANTAGRGGAIYCYDHGWPAVVNCTIADNVAASGDGIACMSAGGATVCNSIVWNRIFALPATAVTATYSDTLDCWPGAGNICAEPEFVDPANGEYHLLPTSPGIDVGTNGAGDCVPPLDDIDGQPRPWPLSGVVDMGADESYPPPTCEVGYTPSMPTTDDAIVFDSGADDPYDAVVSVSWDFGDGDAGEGDPAGHQYAMPGSYQLTAVVCNAAGLCATCAIELTVGKGANIPPVCDVTCDSAQPAPSEEASFDANADDPNPWGEIVSCQWDFGDGCTAGGDPVTHAYADDGSYTVCATVTDDQGGQAICCARVTVVRPCECDVAIERRHCKLPAAGHVGQCRTGQIGARNLSVTESCDVVLRVIDNAGNVVFETTRTIGPGRGIRIRVRFEHCYTADEVGRNPWTWEAWPADCGERTPWDNVHLRKVNVHP